MKKSAFLFILLSFFAAKAQDNEMDSFIDDLMSKMTLQEKIGQLNLLPGGDITTGAEMESPIFDLAAKGQLGAILNIKGQEKIRLLQETAVKKSRLGIPVLVGQDVIHGNVTVFPIPLAQACSWNLEAIENGARIAAREATAQGIAWTYSPMVDIALDPRWGRVAEGAGEDPYYTGLVGQAMIRGYQGNYGKENMMACVKHFALYGAAEAGRDYNTVDMSRLRMFNQYLPPYRAALEANPGSFMSSFNVVDGIPATLNGWLLNEVLRNKWKFDGFVVTDYASINEAVVHGVGDQKTCVVKAIKAGTDMDMCAFAYIAHLEKCVEEGSVSVKDIDTACRRVLAAKYKLGLFADPYRFCDAKRLKTDLYTTEHRAAARDMAAQSFVLLKNADNLLPLKKQGTIALIGPLADTRNNLPGCWSTGDEVSRYTTLKEAMINAVGKKARVLYAQGCNIYGDEKTQNGATFNRPIPRVDDKAALEEALKTAAQADVVVCALGEMAEMSGESSSRTDLSLPEVQMNLLKAIVATGKPVVLLNFSGRPTIMKWESENVPAILNVWWGGSELGDAVCDIVFGDKAPSGRLVTTMPRALGQVPLYYNHLRTGRPIPEGHTGGFMKYQSNYLDESNDPLYPFGYGLTYTTFKYSDALLNGNKVSLSVTNTGSREATEVVQLYINDPVASVARPVKELKAFRRIVLKPGETANVEFEITRSMLTYYNAEGDEVFEPGDFNIMVGCNSSDAALQTLKYTIQ